MGTSAQTAGKLLQTAVELGSAGDHVDCNSTAVVAAGSKTVSIETDGTDLVANGYKDGYMWINDGTGEGQLLSIKSHPAHDHSDDFSCEFTLYDPVVTALAAGTSTMISIMPNKFNKLVLAATTETGASVGVTPRDISASNYFWVQTAGPACIWAKGTLVIGNGVVRDVNEAGSVAPATDNVLELLGSVMRVNVTDDYALIDLRIEG